jgi:hypothetical protein
MMPGKRPCVQDTHDILLHLLGTQVSSRWYFINSTHPRHTYALPKMIVSRMTSCEVQGVDNHTYRKRCPRSAHTTHLTCCPLPLHPPTLTSRVPCISSKARPYVIWFSKLRGGGCSPSPIPTIPPSISRNKHPTAPLVSTYVPLPLHYCKTCRQHEKKAANTHHIHSTASHPVDCGAYNTYRHPRVVQRHVNDANRSHKYTETHRESLTTQETPPDHLESSTPIAIPKLRNHPHHP